MKQDLRYTHGDIFETFPFPDGVLENEQPLLSASGQEFFEARRDYMLKHNKGLTKFYNDFHDVRLQDDEMQRLRGLQVRINDEILAIYSFEGITLQHDFYEVGYMPEGKNARFTISEAAREALLHRLAMLNKSRSEEDAQSASETTKPRKPGNPSLDDLFSATGD